MEDITWISTERIGMGPTVKDWKIGILTSYIKHLYSRDSLSEPLTVLMTF